METRLEGIPLFLHAIDLVLTDRDQLGGPDRAEALELLNALRQKLQDQARSVEGIEGCRSPGSGPVHLH